MSLIKDGKIYRTPEEQLLHLTQKHLEQEQVNRNVSEKLKELTVSANLGGYNLVRKVGGGYTTYRINKIGYFSIKVSKGDFIEITSLRKEDIPAYGYINQDGLIDFSFYGDFKNNLTGLVLINKTSNDRCSVEVEMVMDFATSLSSLNPNNYKKQLFNVLEDENYGVKTQYVSFDLNNDGVYNFVYLGPCGEGRDGCSVYAIDEVIYKQVLNILKAGDSVVACVDIEDFRLYEGNYGIICGDVLEYIGGNEFRYIGNVRGQRGEKGEKGDKGEQGLQGVQGVQGIQGEKGEKGEKGDPGTHGLRIFSGILGNTSLLPEFSKTTYGTAYRVINTSGSVITYDLYFHAYNGSDWDIQPNWGGVKGAKGDKGEQGLQGIQGVQGVQGEKGEKGEKGDTGAPGRDGKPRFIHSLKFRIALADGQTRGPYEAVLYHNDGMPFNSGSFFDYMTKHKFTLPIRPFMHGEVLCTSVVGTPDAVSIMGFKFSIVDGAVKANVSTVIGTQNREGIVILKDEIY